MAFFLGGVVLLDDIPVGRCSVVLCLTYTRRGMKYPALSVSLNIFLKVILRAISECMLNMMAHSQNIRFDIH